MYNVDPKTSTELKGICEFSKHGNLMLKDFKPHKSTVIVNANSFKRKITCAGLS